MQPITIVFDKCKQLVKEFEITYQRKLKLEIFGADVELDKLMIESLTEQLTALIKNFVVFGIESPEVRLQRGKPEHGTIKLKCYYNHGFINIDMIDDGAGIDQNFVIKVAVEKGIISKEEAKKLTKQQIQELFLVPDILMNAEVIDSSVSTVGIDVVKLNIERLGGSFSMSSVLGQGVSVNLKIPPTFSIIPAIIFMKNGITFVLPKAAAHELLIVKKGDEKVKIEYINNFNVLNNKNKLLPLLNLRADLKIFASLPEDDFIKVLVVSVDTYEYGLIIDDFIGVESVIVKRLPHFLNECLVYSGVTILANGAIGFILNTAGIATRAGISFMDIKKREEELAPQTAEAEKKQETSKHKVLLFSGSENKIFGLYFEQVKRVEKRDVHDIIFDNEKEYINYEKNNVRMIQLENYLSDTKTEKLSGEFQVIIVKVADTYLAVATKKIIDTLETELNFQPDQDTPIGFLGNCEIAGQSVLFADIGYF